MKLVQRVTSTGLLASLLLISGLVGATAAQAGPSDGTGITTHTLAYPDGTRMSTISGFSTGSACENAKSAKLAQLSKAGYAIKWVNKCYSKNSKFAYQVLYWP